MFHPETKTYHSEVNFKNHLSRRKFLSLLSLGVSSGILSCNLPDKTTTPTPIKKPEPTLVPQPSITPPFKEIPTIRPTATLVPGPDFSNSTAKAIFLNWGKIKDDFTWIAKPDGTDSKQIVTNDVHIAEAYTYGALWSPAYDKFLLGNYIFNSNAQLEQTISEFLSRSGKYKVPLMDRHWFPSGNSLIYTSSFGNRSEDGLYEYNLINQSHKQVLKSEYLTVDNSSVISPDGQKLVFTHHEYGGNGYVTVTELSPTKYPYPGLNIAARKYHPDLHVLDNVVNKRHDWATTPYWTPDSRKLVYLLRNDLHITDTKTGNIINVPFNSPFEKSISISPKGDRFAVGNNDHRIVIFDLDGKVDKEIDIGPNNQILSNENISNVLWLSEQNSLALIHGGEIKHINLITNQVTILPNRFPTPFGPLSFTPFNI